MASVVAPPDHRLALLVAGMKVTPFGDGTCPGENLLRWSWYCVGIDHRYRHLARDRMRDNPLRHRRSRRCLETSNSRVRAATNATGMGFHQHIAPVFALPKHALKNSCPKELVPRFGQRWVLQVVCEHGQPVHLPEFLVVDLRSEKYVETREARLVAGEFCAAFVTAHGVQTLARNQDAPIPRRGYPAATTDGGAGIRPSRWSMRASQSSGWRISAIVGK